MTADPALWHDLECGSFAADLPAWLALASEAEPPILELGAGTGRVALALAREGGKTVIAMERDPELAATLRERAASVAGVTVVEQDARAPALDRRFGLIVGAMQFVQLFSPADRGRLLHAASRRLLPGGRIALAVVEHTAIGKGRADGAAVPDMRERDGWVHASRPLWVTAEDGMITVTRERESVSPGGAIERSVHRDRLYALDCAELAREAAEAGLTPVDRVPVEPDHEARSVILVLMGPR